MDLGNWALRTSPKFTTEVKYPFYQGIIFFFLGRGMKFESSNPVTLEKVSKYQYRNSSRAFFCAIRIFRILTGKLLREPF